MERNGKKLNFSPLFANLHLEKNAGDELPPLSHLQPFQLYVRAKFVQFIGGKQNKFILKFLFAR